ncbi:MAG: HAD-IA family hydrolase, partial [Patescibacteria group bacterium]|nr:HAD-IA family hydrolase [Patescibacteria group bacterium]
QAGGFSLGLLSVHVREWVEFSERKFNYHRYFQVRQYSFEVGLCKPNPQVYRKILGDLGCEPQTALFIDDRPRNVDAAKAFGIRGLVFENAEKLQCDLAAFGIVV